MPRISGYSYSHVREDTELKTRGNAAALDWVYVTAHLCIGNGRLDERNEKDLFEDFCHCVRLLLHVSSGLSNHDPHRSNEPFWQPFPDISRTWDYKKARPWKELLSAINLKIDGSPEN